MIKTSEKLEIINDEVNHTKTTYSNTFLDNAVHTGREKVDFDNLDMEQIQTKCIKKTRTIYKNIKMFNKYSKVNKFNKWVTIGNATKSNYTRFIDNLKYHDENIKYMSVASYGNTDYNDNIGFLHYHIFFNTTLENDIIENTWINKNVKIYDLETQNDYINRVKYCLNNLRENRDILEMTINENNISVKLDVLKHGKLISNSRNINKPVKIENDDEVKKYLKENREKLDEKFSKAYYTGNSTNKFTRYEILELFECIPNDYY